jgi:mannose-1-phosphate guanylyltransferase
MKAVILVGGFGTRLRPLTLSLPKQMLPVGDITMLERVVEHLGNVGVEEVVLSLGYQPEVFLREFPDGECAGVHIRYAVEPEPLDTGGAIAFAAREAGITDTFIALNGDVLTDLDVAQVWQAHQGNDGRATIALTEVDDPSRYGVVPLDAEGRVTAFIEKPGRGQAPSHWINAGTYVLEPDVLDLVPAGARVSIEREVFPALVEEGSLFGLQSAAYWIDAGTPEAYLQAHLDLLDGLRGTFEVAVDDTARVDTDALVKRSVVGAGAIVAAGARVVDSVVMAGARISSGAVVNRSLIGARSVVGEGCDLSDLTVVGFDEDVPAGTSAVAGRFPPATTWPAT